MRCSLLLVAAYAACVTAWAPSPHAAVVRRAASVDRVTTSAAAAAADVDPSSPAPSLSERAVECADDATECDVEEMFALLVGLNSARQRSSPAPTTLEVFFGREEKQTEQNRTELNYTHPSRATVKWVVEPRATLNGTTAALEAVSAEARAKSPPAPRPKTFAGLREDARVRAYLDAKSAADDTVTARAAAVARVSIDRRAAVTFSSVTFSSWCRTRAHSS